MKQCASVNRFVKFSGCAAKSATAAILSLLESACNRLSHPARFVVVGSAPRADSIFRLSVRHAACALSVVPRSTIASPKQASYSPEARR